jgi:hypothetical protein
VIACIEDPLQIAKILEHVQRREPLAGIEARAAGDDSRSTETHLIEWADESRKPFARRPIY